MILLLVLSHISNVNVHYSFYSEIIILSVLSFINGASGHYCNLPQCAGFSLIESVHAKDIRADFMELIWQPKENYSVEHYEVHWYADPDCLKSVGQLTLFNSTVKISVKPCTMYTFEVYGIDSNLTTAPAIIKKVSAPGPLIDGCTVRVGGTWAIIRWFQTIKCSESTHIAVCYGPNILAQLKPFHEDNVVIFHFTNLNENSAYTCIAYTLNSAGSSAPSVPVIVKTETDILNENNRNYENTLALSAILILPLAITTLMILLYRKRYLRLPWRRNYVVNDTRI